MRTLVEEALYLSMWLVISEGSKKERRTCPIELALAVLGCRVSTEDDIRDASCVVPVSALRRLASLQSSSTPETHCRWQV